MTQTKQPPENPGRFAPGRPAAINANAICHSQHGNILGVIYIITNRQSHLADMDTNRNYDHLHSTRFERQMTLERTLAEFQEVCRRAYWQGFDAALRGIRVDQNPYPQHSGGAYFWRIGHIGSDDIRPPTPTL